MSLVHPLLARLASAPTEIALPAPGVPWTIIGALVTVAALAAGAATLVAVQASRRRLLLARLADGQRGSRRSRLTATAEALFGAERAGARWTRVAAWVDEWLPERFTPPETAARLVQAGIHDPAFVVLHGALRLVAPVALPMLLLATLSAGAGGVDPLLCVLLGAGMGLVLPRALLDTLVSRRQTALRRALPDALDLLVVCLEAGVSVDAALLRVTRELQHTAPELAAEFSSVNRRVSAGIPREEALHGLHQRTGVDELRGLATAMIQGEKWGTSLSRILRIYSESIRTKRRQLAEARAARASVKMIFPLVVFLLPAFFTVVLGPAVLSLVQSLSAP